MRNSGAPALGFQTRPFHHCVSPARSWLPRVQMGGLVGEQTCPGHLFLGGGARTALG